MNARRYTLPLLLLTTLGMLIGCGDSSTQFVSFAIPKGVWYLEKLDTQNGIEHRHQRTVTLSDTLGVVADTFQVRNDGLWETDSTASLTLHFQSIGDGYQRAVEIRNEDRPNPDSLVHYWYFFKQGDSLHYYTGMRFVGNNPGLQGTWNTDEHDSALLRGMTWLNFYGDSLTISRRSAILGNSDRSFPYHTEQNRLVIDGIGDFYGERYELIPGFALYITSQAGEGLAFLRR